MMGAAFLSLLLLQTPDSVLSKVQIEQNLGQSIDLNLEFRDEQGATVRLGDLFRGKPVLLTPVYFGCPMLCGMQLNALVRALKVLPFSAGKEFDVISFSFDPAEGAALALEKKAHYIRDYQRAGAEEGWHFLTGDPESIARLTEAIGFRYAFDERTGQWAHASALVVVTPSGRVSQYLNGIDYDQASLKYSVMEASSNRVGTIVDRVLLFCYAYDPHSGKYSLVVMRVIRLAALGTMMGFVAFWAAARRRSS